MKTLPLSPVREKADWPYHSTCMLFLQFLKMPARGRFDGRLVGVVVAAAAQQRGRGGDQAGDDGEGEGGVEAVAERAGDQVREEARGR